MGELFVAANSQYIKNSTPGALLAGKLSGNSTFCMGCWFLPNTVTGSTMMSIGQISTLNNSVAVQIGTNAIQAICRVSGLNNPVSIATTPVAGAWHYVLYRQISQLSRRLACITPIGNVGAANDNTDPGTGVAMDTIGIGAIMQSTVTSFFDGIVAEAWWSSNDINPTDANITLDLLFELAYKGPFAFPNLMVVEYLSLKDWIPPNIQGGPLNNQRSLAPSSAIPNWAPVAVTGSPTISYHPPGTLAPDYIRPEESYNIMIV